MFTLAQKQEWIFRTFYGIFETFFFPPNLANTFFSYKQNKSVQPNADFEL